MSASDSGPSTGTGTAATPASASASPVGLERPRVSPSTPASAASSSSMPDSMTSALQRHRPSQLHSEAPVSLTQLRFGVNLRDLIIFTRQLATMINSGLPLHRSLEALTGQTSNPLFKSQLQGVGQLLSAGTSLTSALKRFPRTFSPLYVSLVDAAERSGSLDVTLIRIAEYLEKTAALRQQIRTAVTYPVTVLTVAVVVISLMLFKVVPTFERMFASSGTSLPPETQAVLAFSRTIQGNLLFIIVGVLSISLGFAYWYSKPSGRKKLDEYLLRVPWVGDLIVKISVARFCRTLSTMVSAGVPILEAMDSCIGLAGNRSIEQGIRNARASIVSGKTLAEGLERTGVFPTLMYTMLGVGESAGELEQMLTKVAEYYDEEVDAAVSGMVAMIEPMLMVFLGIVVGGLLIAMYLPVFTMSSMVGQGS